MKESFPKIYRVTGKNRIKAIFELGISFQVGRLRVLYHKNSLSNNAFLLCVSKKTGKANVRNHIKRLFREAIRKSNLKHNSSFDIAILCSDKSLRTKSLDFYSKQIESIRESIEGRCLNKRQ